MAGPHWLLHVKINLPSLLAKVIGRAFKLLFQDGCAHWFHMMIIPSSHSSRGIAIMQKKKRSTCI